MINSFVNSIMNMSIDIYTQQNTQVPGTGAISRQWVYDRTIPCKAEPMSSGGVSSQSESKTFDRGNSGGYAEKLHLKVKTQILLSKRWRIHSVRSSDGKQVFVEIDKYDQPDSIFEVISSHAVLDPFGKVSYYEAIVQRVQIQNNDKTSN